jgi:hypothetical protein
MSESICSVENCNSPVKAKGLCSKHHQRWYRHGDPLYKKYTNYDKPLKPLKPNLICSVEGCENVQTARGMCTQHYTGWYYKNVIKKK